MQCHAMSTCASSLSSGDALDTRTFSKWARCLSEISGGSSSDSCFNSVRDDWGYRGNSLSQARRLEEDRERQLVVNPNTCKYTAQGHLDKVYFAMKDYLRLYSVQE